tara:strand:- start:1103 stop:1837 length:735 start_codon:yes stop_codon:yes gene_type:complete
MKNYKKTSYLVRKKIIKINAENKAAHLGSCLSCVEILLACFEFIKPRFENIIFSKGHAALAFYTVYENYSKKINSNNHLKKGSSYWAHLTKDKRKKINYSFGSLGYGAGVAAGISLAKKNQKILCILSDGELNEGSVWESLFFISHHKLKNVTILIDQNKLQSFGKTKDIINVDYKKIFYNLNYNCFHVDGHNIIEILKKLNLETKKPKIIICKTIKGKGIRKYENKVNSHYYPANIRDINLLQ